MSTTHCPSSSPSLALRSASESSLSSPPCCGRRVALDAEAAPPALPGSAAAGLERSALGCGEADAPAALAALAALVAKDVGAAGEDALAGDDALAESGRRFAVGAVVDAGELFVDCEAAALAAADVVARSPGDCSGSAAFISTSFFSSFACPELAFDGRS